MGVSELFQSAQQSTHNLGQHWAIKGVCAAVIGAAFSMHAQLLLAFVGLVFLDLATKWVALSYSHLAKRRKKNLPTLWQAVKNIPAARKAGYIKSTVMKDRFLGKILVYLFIVLAGGLVDTMMSSMKNPTWAVVLCVGYLSATEMISILENLQDAGVEEAAKLHELVENRKNLIK
jgi:phage-related holin